MADDILDQENEESSLVPPDEVVRRRKATTASKATEEKKPLASTAGMVRVEYESNGRFTTPTFLYYTDYKAKHINALSLSRQEDLLRNLVSVLNEMKSNEVPEEAANFDVGDHTPEEFYETLIGIKQQFVGDAHKHLWLCDCQEEVPDKEKKLSEQVIMLSSIKYSNIEEADQKLKEQYKGYLEDMTDEELADYLLLKHNEEIEITKDNRPAIIEDELANVRIQEPITLGRDGKVYRFRFTRIKDMIRGFELASKDFTIESKRVRGRYQNMQSNPGLPMNREEVSYKRDMELKKLDEQRAQRAILYSKCLSLISVDGVPLTDEQRIEIFSNIDRGILDDFTAFLDPIVYGVNDEREFVCNLCNKPERGFLHQRITPLEFLPIADDRKSTARKKLGVRPTTTVFFGG